MLSIMFFQINKAFLYAFILTFGIWLFNICTTNKIIGTCTEDVSDTAQNFCWNASDTDFITGVCSPIDKQFVCNLLLCHIHIFSQIADSFIYHKITSKRLYHATNRAIDIWYKLWHNIFTAYETYSDCQELNRE